MASIVPTLISGDMARLGETLDAVEVMGIPTIHIDVMDGHFRPQISLGQPVVGSIRGATRLKLDVHLLVERPERYFEDFVKAGADSLLFHVEATPNVAPAINSARKLGTQVGLALNPGTRVETCYEVLEYVDTVLIETGSKNSLSRSLERVSALVKEREDSTLSFAVAAEGAIGAREADGLLAAGADILVVGRAIFDKGEDGEAMRALARTLNSAGQEAKFPV
jgi:ribulose-phosphate 3-epimerase